MVAGHIISQNLYTTKYIYPVRATMTIIATTFLNLPFANQILNAFNEYSNEHEFTANGIFRRINSLACPCCGNDSRIKLSRLYSILQS
jgi:hypothetical protein